MTEQEVRQKVREIKLLKAMVRRDAAKRDHARNADLQRQMPGAIAAKDVEDSETALDLAELDVQLWKARCETDEGRG